MLDKIDLSNSRTLTILVIIVLILFAIVYVCMNRDGFGNEGFANYPVAVGDVVQLQGGLNNVQVGNDNTPLSTTLNNLIKQELNNSIPSLTVVSYYGNIAPTGWQLCDGKNLKDTNGRVVYDNDGNLINTPNLQGRVIVGTTVNTNTPLADQNGASLKTYNLGNFSGEEKHILTTSEMPSHNHNMYDWTYTDGHKWGGGLRAGNAGENNGLSTNALQGENKPHNIMQPYYTLTYIIKQPIKP